MVRAGNVANRVLKARPSISLQTKARSGSAMAGDLVRIQVWLDLIKSAWIRQALNPQPFYFLPTQRTTVSRPCPALEKNSAWNNFHRFKSMTTVVLYKHSHYRFLLGRCCRKIFNFDTYQLKLELNLTPNLR